MSENPKKKAQTQVDKAMAEVARLKEVAETIEESNQKAQADHDKTVDALQANIAKFADEESAGLKSLEIIKEKIEVEESKKIIIIEENKVLKSEVSSTQVEFNEQKDALASVKEEKVVYIEKIDNTITLKKEELVTLESTITEKELDYSETESGLKTFLDKVKRELGEAEELVKSEAKVLETTLGETKKAQTDASGAEYSQSLAEKKLAEAEERLEIISKKIDIQSEELTATVAEVETAKEELRLITIDRINSKNFMEELKNKETNLKKKYEDVGLEYK